MSGPAISHPLRVAQSWSVPAALGFGAEPFEGAAILDEVPGEQALLLWQILRDVDVWLMADRPAGRILFAPEASAGRQRQIETLFPDGIRVHPALDALAALLRGRGRSAGEVSAACAALARWASEQGFARTAFAAALRAGISSPREPSYCYLAGLMARRAADYVRAEAWLKRALALSRRVNDGRHYGLSLMSLANLHMARYEGGPAIRRLRQAIKAARRFALWDLRALAAHDLFVMSTTHGSPAQTVRYAELAARGYGRFHARLPALAHDVAWFLLLWGRPVPALGILQELDTRSMRPQEQLMNLSTMGRAAGAAGEAKVFWRIWGEFWRRLDEVASYDRAAESLVNLAWGAVGLNDLTRVEVAAREALRIAVSRDEGQEIEAAGRMLACLELGRLPEPPVRVICSTTDLADALDAAERLVKRLVQAPALRKPATTA
jgi:tetratricopeptide (TPR) repeat protein